jgi:zinc protease
VDVAATLKDFKGEVAAAPVEAFDPTPANLDARTQRFALASGLKAALLPKATRGKVVSARLRLNYGDEKSLFGQETVAGFTGSLLDKGTARLSRQQIRDRLDQLSARLSLSADDQVLSASIATTRENLPAVIELLGQLLREPAFPPDALEELRSQALTGIEQNRKEPEALVANTLDRHGNTYPRGDLRHASSFDESVQDIQAVKVEGVRNFQRRFYSAANAEFGAAGDMDPVAVKAALEAAFGNWSQPATGAQPYVRIPRPLVEAAPARFVIKTPDKANANFRAVHPIALSDLDPDYPALTVANRIFGGDASSRLWKRLRDQEGFSYDVRSFIDWNQVEPNSRWEASAIFAPQNQPKVEAALREETERALKDGFTQAELDNTRNSLLSLRRQSRTQDATVAGALAGNLYLKRDFSVSQKVDDAIAALTLEQVNAAFRKYIRPDRWATAFGGDFKP